MVKCGGDNSFGETSVPYPSTPVIVSLDQVRGRTYKATWLPAESNSSDASLEYKVKLVSAENTYTTVCKTVLTTCTFRATNLGDAQLVVTATNSLGESMEQPRFESKVLVDVGHYPYPMEGSMDSIGNIYIPVSDNRGNDSHFDKISPSGKITRLFDVGFHWWPDHVSVAITPDDKYLYFTDQDSDPFGCGFRLVKVSLATLQQNTVKTGLCAPSNVAIDRDGTIVLRSGGRAQAIAWWKFSPAMELIGQTTEAEYKRVVLLNHQDSLGNYFTVDCIGYCSSSTSSYVLHLKQRIVPGTSSLIPARPVISSLVSGNAEATINISTPTDVTAQSITGYQYSIDKGATYQNAVIANGSFTITGLTNGVSTSIQIRATNFYGNSLPSAAKAVVPATTPRAPSIGTITSSAGALSIDFSAPNTGGSAITRYEYSLDNGSNWITPKSVVRTSPISVTGLPNATRYQVKIRAINAKGTGQASAAVTASTPVLVPGKPYFTSIIKGRTTLTLDFDAPSNDGGAPISNYTYSLDRGLTWTVVSPASTLTHIVIPVQSYTAYPIALAAINSAGRGAAVTQVALTLK